MHNSVRLAAALLAGTLLCSCGGGVDVEFEDKKYEMNGKTASITVPKFGGETDFAAEVNNELEEKASLLLDNFIKSEYVTDLEMTSEIAHNDGRTVSLLMEGEVSGDKPHGEKIRIPVTIDFAEGKKVTLDELFMDESWKTLADNKMLSLAESKEGDYSELWDIPSTDLLNKENFYIKDGELILYFPPYELSYYRRGYVEFSFTAQELERALSDYGKRILYI